MNFSYQFRKDVTTGKVKKNISIVVTLAASRLNSKIDFFSLGLSRITYNTYLNHMGHTKNSKLHVFFNMNGWLLAIR